MCTLLTFVYLKLLLIYFFCFHSGMETSSTTHICFRAEHFTEKAFKTALQFPCRHKVSCIFFYISISKDKLNKSAVIQVSYIHKFLFFNSKVFLVKF